MNRLKKNEFDNSVLNKNLCFIVFDILFQEGKSLLETPYNDRCNILSESVRPILNYFQVIKREEIRDTQKFTKMMDGIIKNKEEGIVLKKKFSTYCPGIRNSFWVKIKPDYYSFSEDLDFVRFFFFGL